MSPSAAHASYHGWLCLYPRCEQLKVVLGRVDVGGVCVALISLTIIVLYNYRRRRELGLKLSDKISVLRLILSRCGNDVSDNGHRILITIPRSCGVSSVALADLGVSRGTISAIRRNRDVGVGCPRYVAIAGKSMCSS